MSSRIVMMLTAAASLAGCAGVAGPPPTRPAVAVADEATSVTTGDIVGSWTCRELNPYPEMPRMRTAMSFAADGTGTSEASAEPGQPNAPLGGMTATSSFKWRTEGASLVTSDVTLGFGSAPSDALTGAIQSVAGLFDPNAADFKAPNAAKVLQLDKGRFVMRGTGVDDPPVIECTR